MEKTKELLKALCALPTFSGVEREHIGALSALCSEHFDKISADKVGNIIFEKKCGKSGAKKLVLDAHIDIIGLMVNKILEKGFLGVAPIGGIDRRTLPSAEVTVYGKKELYGVIASIPPHLAKGNNVPEWDDIIIDTGLTKEEVEEIVSLGDRAQIYAPFTELCNNFVMCGGLDNRACLCACLCGVMNARELNYDVYVVASAQEETGPFLSRTAIYEIKPDYVITTDVNFAREQGIEKRDSIECAKGPSVDISSLVSRELSRGILKLAKENNVPCQVIVEPTRTGTNNDVLSVTGVGALNALMSIPLKAMHTTCECVCLSDVKALGDIISLILEAKEDTLC